MGELTMHDVSVLFHASTACASDSNLCSRGVTTTEICPGHHSTLLAIVIEKPECLWLCHLFA